MQDIQIVVIEVKTPNQFKYPTQAVEEISRNFS